MTEPTLLTPIPAPSRDARLSLGPETPTDPSLALLLARHGAAMAADTPPESNHAIDAGGLAAEGTSFHVLRLDAVPMAMGAFRRIDATHAEIKSMHVLDEARGRGLARVMLDHLVTEAARAGYRRLSLETGAQDSFAASRSLYASHGFVVCPPFEGYVEDPLSVFMTREL